MSILALKTLKCMSARDLTKTKNKQIIVRLLILLEICIDFSEGN